MINGFATGSPESPDTPDTTAEGETFNRAEISWNFPEAEAYDDEGAPRTRYDRHVGGSLLFQSRIADALAAHFADYSQRMVDAYGGRGGEGPNAEEIPVASPDGTRVFPLATDSYHLTQAFGCVGHNHGYPTVFTCPPDLPSFHDGIDLGAEEGTVIHAAASGTVTFAALDENNASGNTVITIDHNGPNADYRTKYLHWRTSYVEAGDRVVAGQPIGEVGSVGYSTGPHLHFHVWDKSREQAVDPIVWLQTSGTPVAADAAEQFSAEDNVLRWDSLIRAASSKHNIPAALIAAIIAVESSGDPDVVSPADAQGLMQVMPAHFERYGIASDHWLDPETNIDTGSRFLAELFAAHGDLSEVVSGYFGDGCDVLGTCTGAYVDRVFSWYAHFAPIYGSDPVDPELIVAEEPPPTPAPEPSPTPEPASSPEPTSEPEATPEPEPTPLPEPTPEPEPSPEPQPSPSPEPTPTPEVPGEPAGEDAGDDGEDPADETPAIPENPIPVAVADGHGALWYADYEHDRVLRVDPETEHVVAVIEVGVSPISVAVSEDSVWVSNSGDDTVSRIDPLSNAVIATIEVGESPFGVAVGSESIWVANAADNSVSRIDPETNTVIDIVAVGRAPRGLLVTDDGVWVANYADGTVSLIDSTENEVDETHDAGEAPCFLALEDDAILVTSCDHDDVFRLER